MRASSYLPLSTGIISTFLLVINLYNKQHSAMQNLHPLFFVGLQEKNPNGKLRYPGQADLLKKGWETWAPLLFFGRERQMPGKEDQQIVGEVRLENQK